MPGLSPRRLAVVGLLTAVAGVVLDVLLVLSAGGGLSGGYIAGSSVATCSMEASGSSLSAPSSPVPHSALPGLR
jgi:hypothetical protein